MFKLIRYVKKYWLLALAAVVLLFGQAIMDLNLPNMMSNIVNTGIQKSGIEEVAPLALPKDAYEALTGRFMSPEDAAAVQAAYTPYSQLSQAQKSTTDKTFPDAAAHDAYVLTAQGEARTAADAAFGRADYAFVDLLRTLAEQQGQEVSSSNTSSADIDFSAMEELLPMLAQLPPEAFQAAIDAAAAVPATMSDSIAAVLNKAMYQTLGANTDAMLTGYIFRTGAAMLGISLVVMLCALGAGYCFARLGAGIARDLRRDIFAKVNGFTNAEMDKFSTSSLITRTTNDVTQVQVLYTMGMRMLVYAPIMGTGGVIMALRKSVGMSWIIAVAVFLILIIIAVLMVVVMPRFKKMQTLVDRLNLVSRENLTGIMVIRAFGAQDFQQGRFDKANRDLTQNSLFVTRAMATLMPIMMLIMNGISLFIVWLGAGQIANSAIQVGDMMAFIQYAMQIIMSFMFIAMIFILVPRASVSAGRINEVLTSKSIVLDPETPVDIGRAQGRITFKNVSFRYGNADEDVLHNISFTARPGETTAFIGPTGSGKSTLVNLIPRFYDVTEGVIELDGTDIRQLSQKALRDEIGYIPQKGLLFSGTVAGNLRFGDENASDETLRAAAEVAQATEFIDQMEEGFEAEISQGGTNVSGGQRQRLSIARALVKKPPVYIFDDTFSALDFATDAKLRRELKPYTEAATVLIVAQRVSSIMHAQQIIVLEDGRMVGKGTHEELLKNCDLYREIAQSQLSEEELA